MQLPAPDFTLTWDIVTGLTGWGRWTATTEEGFVNCPSEFTVVDAGSTATPLVVDDERFTASVVHSTVNCH